MGAIIVVDALWGDSGKGKVAGFLSRRERASLCVREYGVVTGRMRRKAAEIPWDMLRYAAMLNGPTEIALTFCDHYDPEVCGATAPEQLTSKVRDLIAQVEEAAGAPVTIVETGKLFDHMIDLRPAR